MKLLVEFLSDLKRLGIMLSANGDRLVCNAPKNVVTAEIRKELAVRKAEIVAFLNETQTAPTPAGTGTPAEEIPLSHSQQRLWFITQLDSENPVYNIVMSLWLTGELNHQALERSLSATVERHESLRTGFFGRNGQPFTKVVDAKGWKMAFVDLEHLVSRAAESEAERLATIEARRPFDLEQPPLFRAALFRVSREKALLVLTVHHIVSDGWSLGVLLQELIELYAAFSNGEPSPLAMPSFQFRDYVQWERDAGKKAADQQMPYWLERLGGELPVLELPADRRRPLTQTFNGKRISITIDETLAQRVRGYSRETQTTVFMVLLAAFQALLFHYTGVEDILVGSGIANRQRQEFSAIVGFFVNNLVLRNDLSSNPSFAELLKRVQETAIAAYAHQDVPFERLVETLRPERALNHSPLVQVMFTFQNVPTPKLHFAGLKVEIAGIDPEIARAELSVEVLPRGHGYCCDFEYNTDIFDERTIRQLQTHYVRFLEAAMADPLLAIGSVPLLADAEREQFVYGWNDTEVEFPGDECLHQLFEEQAGKTPQATAVVFEGTSLSYDELNRRANQLAHFLRQLGVKPDARVAICAERGLEMIVGLLAVLKAGGAYVPLDPAYPIERLLYMLDDCAPAVLLMQGHLSALSSGFNARLPILDLSATAPPWGDQPESNPDRTSVGLAPEHLAYVIYTSGSTGSPKGVMVEHRNVVNLLRDWRARFACFKNGKCFAASLWTSFGFDVSVFELFMPLSAGGTVHVVPDDVRADPEGLLQWLLQRRVAFAYLPPFFVRKINELVTAPFSALPFELLLVGVEPLMEAELHRFQSVKPGLQVVNAYGPTEATIFCTTYTEIADTQRNAPIGRPIANTQIYILDGNGQPAPVGVAGELHIGGAGVARGYLSRPEQTAQRFVPDPFAAEPGARMYRTGDLGRWLPDGNIEFLRRNDFQVKVRGFRIELGEIEARLREHPAVREAVVVVREDTPGDNRIVAYYSSADSLPHGSADALRAHLTAVLPEYMVPSAFLALPELPLTPNGKVNRKALPAPEAFAGEHAAAIVAPRNQIEQTLARIWSDVLRVNQVGVHDNFFDLGGHSLLLTKVHARLRQELNSKLALLDLFRYPTIESLARAILKDDGVSHVAAMPSMSQTAVQNSEHPLSRSQQRLWFLDQLNPGNAVYNISLPIRLKGHLPRKILEQALKAVLDRHESLRTSFFEKNGIPYARVERAHDWMMRFADLSNVAADSREDELRRYVEEEAGRPFALDRGPLFRATLVRTAQQEHTLILAVHHIVFDGWSGGVLARELVELMQACLEKRDPALDPPRLQFRDFAVWEQQQDAANNLQMDYWKKQLAGELPLLELPTDHRRPPLQSFRGRRLRVVIARELADRLERVGREQNATFFMVLLACFNVLLLRYSRQEDILVGTPTAGRLRSEFEGLIGFFVNNLVLRTDLSGNPTFVELLKRVRATTLDALEHQSAPFDQLVEELQPERGLDRSPVFQVLFTLQNLPVQKTDFAGLEMSAFEFQTSHARYDLGVDIQAFEEGYRCDFEYSTDLFEEETVRRMQMHYLRLLEAVAADPGRRIGSLPLLNDAEYRLIVEDWNRTESPSPGYATLLNWFRAQAAATPGATAVVMGELALSYAELDRQSGLLARALRERGVGREVIVGLYVTRSLNMVVALLAILKAGGAYLPLDPALPAERIEFLLSDAGVPLILTETSLKVTLPETNAALLAMDETWERSPAPSVHFSDDQPRSEDLAYLIYTSGSTGKPKGTEITHGALVNLLSSMLREPGLRQQDTLVAVTTLSFDIAGLEIFGPLVCGAKLVLASREQAIDPNALAALLEGAGGTVMQATPSSWRALVESGWMGKPDLRMWCGGEALAPDLADNLLTRGRELWNLYGPTETTIWSAAHRVSSGDDPILIGRPIANTQMYILEARGEPVPIGVTGELYIAGDGIARGYWKRLELTETRFVPDPFSKRPNSRMYRTGDLARYRRDGQIQLLGRTDQQIKLRGHRIELGEVEAVIECHAEVQQAVVALDGEGAGQRLIAYVKLTEAAPASDLRGWMQQRLPEYMVPSIFVTLRELPLTPNGKVDRKRLPAAERTAREQTAASIVPRNQMERALARIWSDVLRVSPVGIRDNFFDLGGQSLLLIKVHAKLRQELNADVPVVDLFRYPTIESMAAHLDGRHQAEVAEAVNS